MRKLVLAALVIAVAVGASVGVVLGSGSTASIKASAVGSLKVQMHRVSAPSSKLAGPATTRLRHRAKVIYFESNPFTLSGGESNGGTARCPRRSKAINGYFGEDSNTVFPILNSVGISLRKWTIAVRNGFSVSTPDATAFIGTVCLKP
jgi:hypothetical protein